MSKIVLIDGYSILNRAFYGVPLLTNAQGEHTNGLYGFLNIMWKILDEEQPQYLAVAFDVKAKTFRHQMYTEYKGTRKPMPTELTEQVPMLKELLSAMGIACIEKAGLEADDIIGTLANQCAKQGLEVVIVSGDRDLLQLATDTTMVRIPKTKAGKTEVFNYLAKDFFAEYGVTPTEFIDMKALMGDASDNIPGLPGVGEKTALALIQTYHSIENAYEHRADIKPNKARLAFEEHYELAVLSKKLATIEVEAEISFDKEAAAINDLFTPQAYEIIKRHNFKSFFSRFTDHVKSKKLTSLPKTRLVEDMNEMYNCFAQAKKARHVALAVAASQKMDACGYDLLGVALSMDQWSDAEQAEIPVYIPVQSVLTEEVLVREIYALLQTLPVSVFEIKPLLHILRSYVDLSKEDDHMIATMEDISVLAYLLNPLKGSYSYEELAEQYIGLTLPAKAEVFEKRSYYEMQMLHPQALYDYYGNNAAVCRMLTPLLLKEVDAAGMKTLYETIERPLIYSLFQMEAEGIRVDAEELKNYGERLGEKIRKMEKSIYETCGLDGQGVNLNSPKQLGELLFEKMGIPGGKKNKNGYSTSADILDKLAPDYPIVRKILEYRQLMKLKSTYADGLAGFIRDDGRIHGFFHQTVTATGRISSADPNLQNIPVRMELGREIRKLFIPKEGCVFIDADYSQIELRILADMSQDEHLINAYRMAEDIHTVTASQVFHVPLDEVTPQLRRNAKAVNFGIIYGISAFGLSEDLSISRKEAAQYMERYFETYPKIKAFLQQLVTDAKTRGYSVTTFGRRRPIPELNSSNFMQRSFGERVAMNAPIQGTAADIMKLATIAVDRELRKRNLSTRIVLQVHDELLLEAPAHEAEQVKELLVSCMKNAAQMQVLLEVSAEVGNNWYETK